MIEKLIAFLVILFAVEVALIGLDQLGFFGNPDSAVDLAQIELLKEANDSLRDALESAIDRGNGISDKTLMLIFFLSAGFGIVFFVLFFRHKEKIETIKSKRYNPEQFEIVCNHQDDVNRIDYQEWR